MHVVALKLSLMSPSASPRPGLCSTMALLLHKDELYIAATDYSFSNRDAIFLNLPDFHIFILAIRSSAFVVLSGSHNGFYQKAYD